MIIIMIMIMINIRILCIDVSVVDTIQHISTLHSCFVFLSEVD